MKARFDYQNILHLESETEDEARQLRQFVTEGFHSGFYHYSSALSADRVTAWIAVNYGDD